MIRARAVQIVFKIRGSKKVENLWPMHMICVVKKSGSGQVARSLVRHRFLAVVTQRSMFAGRWRQRWTRKRLGRPAPTPGTVARDRSRGLALRTRSRKLTRGIREGAPLCRALSEHCNLCAAATADAVCGGWWGGRFVHFTAMAPRGRPRGSVEARSTIYDSRYANDGHSR